METLCESLPESLDADLDPDDAETDSLVLDGSLWLAELSEWLSESLDSDPDELAD
ncbi:hypothetical protein [Roseiconus lacunae]|uniref:hypothetical protein n=1 Tax=Roseiconus lacunae TaxID=2605694 RepID=UPI001E34EF52|nr:hypothetical protein [Roseiconus lacunae]MCD0462329.1 hypothetical protein [Roseiconus lacunae]